jgi:hypothetical protein
MEEAVENLQVFDLNLLGFDIEGVTEQIAIEVLAKLPEELIQLLLRLRSRHSAENVTQMACVLDAQRFEVSAIDYVAIKQIAGEHESTQERIEAVRRQMGRRHSVQFLPRLPEVAEQVSIHPLLRIERLAMKMEVLTRFDGQNKGLELMANTVQDFDKTIMLSFGASGLSREGKARVYVYLVRSDQDKNWSDALVPK